MLSFQTVLPDTLLNNYESKLPCSHGNIPFVSMMAHEEQVELPLATESNTDIGVQNYDYELVEFAIDARGKFEP